MALYKSYYYYYYYYTLAYEYAFCASEFCLPCSDAIGWAAGILGESVFFALQKF